MRILIILLTILSKSLFASDTCDSKARDRESSLTGYVVCEKHNDAKCFKMKNVHGAEFSLEKDNKLSLVVTSASVIKQVPVDKWFTIVMQLDDQSFCWFKKELAKNLGKTVVMANKEMILFDRYLTEDSIKLEGQPRLMFKGVEDKNKVLEVCRKIHPKCL